MREGGNPVIARPFLVFPTPLAENDGFFCRVNNEALGFPGTEKGWGMESLG
jgi:hypothetical protein